MRQTAFGLIVPLLLMHASYLRADACWLLTTADFKQRPVSLDAIGRDGVKVTPVDHSGATTIRYDDFLQIERASGSRQTGAKFLLILNNGDWLAGGPLFVKDEQLTV